MFINFNEIPSKENGAPTDEWESFCEEFLQREDFKIIKRSSNGPDGGMDLIVSQRNDPNNVRYLVSCKHYSASSKSVGVKDETSILDRLLLHHCEGFLAFYSTKPTKGHLDVLDAISRKKSVIVFTSVDIEQRILGNPNMNTLFRRYFPVSAKNWKEMAVFKEPLKLLNYYIEKEAKSYDSDSKHIKTIVETIFKDEIDFIEFLRSGKTFDEWSQEKSFKVYKVSNLWKIMNGNYEFKSPKNSWKPEKGQWKMTIMNQFNRAIPAEVEFIYGVRLPAKTFRNQIWLAGYGFFLDYELFQIYDELLFDSIDDIVKPVKELLIETS